MSPGLCQPQRNKQHFFQNAPNSYKSGEISDVKTSITPKDCFYISPPHWFIKFRTILHVSSGTARGRWLSHFRESNKWVDPLQNLTRFNVEQQSAKFSKLLKTLCSPVPKCVLGTAWYPRVFLMLQGLVLNVFFWICGPCGFDWKLIHCDSWHCLLYYFRTLCKQR